MFAGLLRIKFVPSNSVRSETQLPGLGCVAHPARLGHAPCDAALIGGARRPSYVLAALVSASSVPKPAWGLESWASWLSNLL
jgi:hypothetical protein